MTGAAIAGAGLPGNRAEAAPADYDPAAPDHRLRSFMLMRAALDDRLVIGCVSGLYYGVIDDALTPLYGVVGVTFARYRPLPDGTYEGVSDEVAYFTDLETGKAMETWRNPYSNETVPVPQVGFPWSKIIIGKDLTLGVPKPVPGMTLDHRVLPGTSQGDDFWFVEETKTAFQPPGASKPVHYSEIVTLHAKRSDLAMSDVKRVPCQTGYSSIVSWRPWLKMGDRSGHLLGDGFGRYDVPLDQLPPAWLQAAAVKRPDLLKDPASAVAAGWAERT